MKKTLPFLLLMFVVYSGFSQIQDRTRGGRGNMGQQNQNGMFQSDSTQFKNELTIKIDGETHFTDYKKISSKNDTTYIDTTLTILKDRLLNYTRKDNFELLDFHNQGQTYNALAQSFSNKGLFPEMGFKAKKYNYLKIDEIPFFRVPTPSSEIMYRSGLEQGQVLDALVTMNTSPKFNISFAYKGLRSLGKYRHALASHGNFRTNFNYTTENQGYLIRGQYYSYDFLNNENGGLTPASIVLFESNDPNYTDRGRLDVNFTNAENMFLGKRYFLEQNIILSSQINSANKRNKEVSEQLLEYNNVLLEIESLESGKSVSDIKAERGRKKATKGKSKIDSTKDSIQAQRKPTVQLPNKVRDSIRPALPIIDSLTVITKIALDSVQPTTRIPNDSTVLAKKDTLISAPLVLSDSIRTKIDSLKFIATTLKIDSTYFVEVPIKERFRVDLNHKFLYETVHYRFKQSEALSDFFGDSYEGTIADHTGFKKMHNEVSIGIATPYLGKLKFKGEHYNFNYHYNSILFYDNQTISDKLDGNAFAVGASWDKQFGKVFLNANASSIISGDLTGNSFRATAAFKKDSIYSFEGFAELSSRSPDFNKLLLQSDYLKYNWQNDFSNEELKNAGIAFKVDKYGSIEASYNIVDNYTYFDASSRPVQSSETLTYLKAKVHQYFTYKNFTIDNTVMYQLVTDGDSFLHVPELITRNSLYYANHVFKGDPLYLQTGFTLKYFSLFKLNAYDPILSEFVLQDETEFGNFPIVDFFLNLQVKRTRIFLKVENFTGAFTGRKYYAAPNYPYRDLTVRFGLVWNWFI